MYARERSGRAGLGEERSCGQGLKVRYPAVKRVGGKVEEDKVSERGPVQYRTGTHRQGKG